MHENLRFNIKPQKINDWQPILATEFIGTFYMVYIKFLEEPQQVDNIWIAPCQFLLQNWRGSITMGLYYEGNDASNYFKTEIGLNTENLGYSFRIKVAVKPFFIHENPEPPIVPMNFGNEFGEGVQFETEVDYHNPPKDIFNPEDISGSRFLHPLFLYREGENIQHIYYRKDDKEANISVMTGGEFDRYQDKVIEGKPVNLSATGRTLQPERKIGTEDSPTCDAKRSEIIL